MTDLILMRRDQIDGTADVALPGGGVVSITPSIDEDCWSYRVQLTPTQAIVGFPKFGTIGVGFAVEEDWNTNLPYTSGLANIADHISHNRGDAADRELVLEAIRLIRDAAAEQLGVRCLACMGARDDSLDVGHWIEDCPRSPSEPGKHYSANRWDGPRDDAGWPIKDDDE